MAIAGTGLFRSKSNSSIGRVIRAAFAGMWIFASLPKKDTRDPFQLEKDFERTVLDSVESLFIYHLYKFQSSINDLIEMLLAI